MYCLTVSSTWWSLLLTLIIFGAVGGLGRSIVENGILNGSATKKNHFPSAFIGAVAGLVVPLFLNASSSSIIQSILTTTNSSAPSAERDWFFLIGYSVLAGFVGNLFLTSMASRSLKLSQEANNRSQQVADETKTITAKLSTQDVLINTAKSEFEKDVNRTRDLIRPIALIDDEKYSEALKKLEESIQNDPKNAEAYAWLAYCFRHQIPADIQAAIGAIETALELEEPKPFSWLYNKACYQALADVSDVEVVKTLQNAFDVASEQQKKLLLRDLTDDPDFAMIRDRNHDSAFSKFFRVLKRSA
jgi:tetratricopeptide (TPR) repeat protein